MLLLEIILTVFLFSTSQGSDEETRLLASQSSRFRVNTYQVAIVYRNCLRDDPCEDSEDKIFACSGGLLTPTAVLTSASCFFQDSRLKTYTVRAGLNWNLNYAYSEISKIIFRDGFSRDKPWSSKSSQFVDLAVVHLKNAFKSSFKTLQLPTAAQFCSNREFSVSGWAKEKRLAMFRFKSDPLIDTYTVVPTEECRKQAKSSSKPFFDVSYDHHVCVSAVPTTYDASKFYPCTENLGAPLLKDQVIHGVFSFVKEDCSNVQPAVFTKVYPFTNWIQEVVKNDNDFEETIVLYE